MKKQSNALFTKFSKDSLADLTKEVKETLAAGFNQPCQKTFTAANLWNIQRHGKSMVQRRFIF
jgi:hypothetical protein